MKAPAVFPVLALTLIATAVHAQATPKKTAIHIDCQPGESPLDTVGSQFCSALRDTFARSPRYYSVPYTDKGLHFILHVTTIEDTPGITSAQSTVLTFSSSDNAEMYVESWTSVCGVQRAKEQAEAIMSVADSEMTKLNKN